MATNTTNFNLKKPAYTDTADIMDINGNMDKVDTSLQGLGSGLAIISKNNTHPAITTGQYVYVHGHGSLTEGLYMARNNISANATLSTSNLMAVSAGGLNDIYNTFYNNQRVNSLTSEQGIKTVALNEDLCPNYSVRWFNLRNSMTSELPNADAAFGIAEVRSRTSGARTVTIYAENNNIYFASYSGSWSNWRKVSNEPV